LRAAVIYCKLSLGSCAQGGERIIERRSLSTKPVGCSAARSRATSLTSSRQKARGDPVPTLT
jgi:hypothetical protein